MSRYRRAKIEGGVFFFTVALADRSSDLLVRHVDRLRQVYASVQHRRPFESIAICILPDHLHALWSLPEGDADFSLRWSLIKSGFSRGLPSAAARSSSKITKRERGLWQRRYWEHAIRDDKDLNRHVDYIHFNPVKHGYVSRVNDWAHSSFHRYVERGDLPRIGVVTCEICRGNSANDAWARREDAPLPTLRSSAKPRGERRKQARLRRGLRSRRHRRSQAITSTRM